MARIVYGVSGEGSGHSSRASVIGKHLVVQGHDVRMVSYDRGYANLRDDFDVFEVEGLHIVSKNNKVSRIWTVIENLKRTPAALRKFAELRRELFAEFDPEVVITDFEPMTAYLAWMRGVPLITIDNQHRIRYMDFTTPRGLGFDRMMTELVIRLMVPKPDVSLVTTFYFGEPRNDRTFLFPPMLRDEVRGMTPSDDGHILVYLSFGYDSFLRVLEAVSGHHFIVYGYDKSGTVGRITYKPFSKMGFVEDLASSSAVMATAGFTLTTESLYLGKPYLSLPMDGQFEQQLNGHLLEELGFGMNMKRANRFEVVAFLARLEEYRANLAHYDAGTEDGMKQKLDELLADDCALARRYHQRRRGRAEEVETLA